MKLNHPVGLEAEKNACEYLKKHGWHVIERNWHCFFGEIDIIASKKEILVFFEVKFRKNKQFGGAIESINFQKLKKLKKTIEYYLVSHPTEKIIRVDAILIEGQMIEHIENIMSG